LLGTAAGLVLTPLLLTGLSATIAGVVQLLGTCGGIALAYALEDQWQKGSDQQFERLRRSVRACLLDRGLLLLALEPDPGERLPTLANGARHWAVLPQRAEQRGSLRVRLEQLVERFPACCRDLDIGCPAGFSSDTLTAAVRLELAALLGEADATVA
jgi:hypothetical protein